MEPGILSSLEDIASVKLAVEICLRLKKVILAVPSTDGYPRYEVAVKQWTENVERKATMIQNGALPVTLKKKIIELVPAIGRRMLIWAYYHYSVFGFSRENSLNFLNSTHFSQRGIVDHKKAAEELLKGSTLNIQQKYKLACLYCLEDQIAVLHKEMIEEFGEDFSAAREFQEIELIKFWSDHLSGKTPSIEQGENGFEKFRLEIALKSGSKPAVEFCISRSNLDAHLVTAALTTMQCNMRCNSYDCRIFERWDRTNDMPFLFVPSDFHMDILSYLLSRMGNEQLLKFLKKDIRGGRYFDYCEMRYRSRVLEYFLNWPHQDHFMEKAKLMWKFLPRKSYAALLLNICDKILPWNEDRYDCSVRGNYDYRRLLREFWCQSPESHKKCVLSNHAITYLGKSFESLLVKLLTLETFTCEDKENLEIILSGATNVEKENISYTAMKSICSQLIKNEKWRLIEWVELNCFSSKEKAEMFKKQFTIDLEAQHIFIDFVKGRRMITAAFFLTWSSLSQDEIIKLKKQIINRDRGLDACFELVSSDRTLNEVDKFVKWFIPCEDDLNSFKKRLICNIRMVDACIDFLKAGEWERLEELLNWCSENEKAKEGVPYMLRAWNWTTLLSDSRTDGDANKEQDCMAGEVTTWELAEKFLSLCFTTEEEISDFKQKVIFDKYGVSINCHFTSNGRFSEAEEFFAWLTLSDEDIAFLKVETLVSDSGMEKMCELLRGITSDLPSDGALKEWVKIERYLKWFLEDEDAVIEFGNEFDEAHGFSSYEYIKKNNNIQEGVLNEFYSLLNKLYNSLHQVAEGSNKQSDVSREVCRRNSNEMEF